MSIADSSARDQNTCLSLSKPKPYMTSRRPIMRVRLLLPLVSVMLVLGGCGTVKYVTVPCAVPSPPKVLVESATVEKNLIERTESLLTDFEQSLLKAKRD